MGYTIPEIRFEEKFSRTRPSLLDPKPGFFSTQTPDSIFYLTRDIPDTYTLCLLFFQSLVFRRVSKIKFNFPNIFSTPQKIKKNLYKYFRHFSLL